MNEKLNIGESVTIRHPAFAEVLDEIDEKLTMALLRCFQSKNIAEAFDINAKISFSSMNGKVQMLSYETGFKFEPLSYKVKQNASDSLTMVEDYKGNPIFPDQPTQIHMSDLEVEDE